MGRRHLINVNGEGFLDSVWKRLAMADERKQKHLELIQGVINRLSTNSFLLKGWSVILVSALFVLSAADGQAAFVFLASISVIVFWGLDGFFLWQEQLYRKLYDHVRQINDSDIDFSMDTEPFKKWRPFANVGESHIFENINTVSRRSDSCCYRRSGCKQSPLRDNSKPVHRVF